MVSVNNSASNGKLTLDMVINRLRNEESIRKSVEAVPSKSDELVSEKQERRGRSQSKNSYRQNNDNRRIKFFHCHKMGHVKRECRLWKREIAKENGDAQKNDNRTLHP